MNRDIYVVKSTSCVPMRSVSPAEEDNLWKNYMCILNCFPHLCKDLLVIGLEANVTLIDGVANGRTCPCTLNILPYDFNFFPIHPPTYKKQSLLAAAEWSCLPVTSTCTLLRRLYHVS